MKVNLLSKPPARPTNDRWIWVAYVVLGILHVVLAVHFANEFLTFEVLWLFGACFVMAVPCRRFYGDWSHLWIIPMVTVASTWLAILGIVLFTGPTLESSLVGLVWALFITVPEILVALAVRWYVNWLEY